MEHLKHCHRLCFGQKHTKVGNLYKNNQKIPHKKINQKGQTFTNFNKSHQITTKVCMFIHKMCTIRTVSARSTSATCNVVHVCPIPRRAASHYQAKTLLLSQIYCALHYVLCNLSLCTLYCTVNNAYFYALWTLHSAQPYTFRPPITYIAGPFSRWAKWSRAGTL